MSSYKTLPDDSFPCMITNLDELTPDKPSLDLEVPLIRVQRALNRPERARTRRQEASSSIETAESNPLPALNSPQSRSIDLRTGGALVGGRRTTAQRALLPSTYRTASELDILNPQRRD